MLRHLYSKELNNVQAVYKLLIRFKKPYPQVTLIFFLYNLVIS